MTTLTSSSPSTSAVTLDKSKLDKTTLDLQPEFVLASSRRTVLKSSFIAGFALSVSPVWAQVITTPSDGLAVDEISVPSSDGFAVKAYRAMPQNAKNAPILLVMHEIFGVHEHIRDVCRRFAKLGYCAIAPDLFARYGDVSQETSRDKLMLTVGQAKDGLIMDDLDALLAFAKASPQVDPAKAGIVGYCWGGRVVWLYAAHNPQLKAGVAWYGILSGDTNALRPTQPLTLAATIKPAVLGLYGEADPANPIAQIKQMQEELAAAHAGSRIITYPNTGHAFFADYRPTYVKSVAEDSWQHATQWLKEHGL